MVFPGMCDRYRTEKSHDRNRVPWVALGILFSIDPDDDILSSSPALWRQDSDLAVTKNRQDRNLAATEMRAMLHNLRTGGTIVALILLAGLSTAQDDAKKKPQEPPRFGFLMDEELYPQRMPADAMRAVVTAIDRRRVDYLLAHLVDPVYVDYWVNEYKKDFTLGSDEGRRLLAFERLARETNLYCQNDPLIIKDLRVFAREAKWTDEGDTSVGVVESIPARKVFMKKFGERWFLENRQQ